MAQMKVAEVPKPGQPLALAEKEIPDPRAGQVRVRAEACGIPGDDGFQGALRSAFDEWGLSLGPGFRGVRADDERKGEVSRRADERNEIMIPKVLR